MSENRRIQKVEKEVRQVIANYLVGQFRGPLRGIVSVSRVVVSKDLRQAKVYITVFGSDEDREVSMEGLEAYAGEIQKEISRRLVMKFCPKLKFFIDEGADKVMKVDSILHELHQKGEFGSDGDSE